MTEREIINRLRAAANRNAEPDPLGPARQRYSRPRLEPGSRTRSTVGQVAPTLPLRAPPSRAQQRAEYDAAQRSVTRPRAAPAYQPPSNQFAEAGQYGLEMTGLPSVRRSARAFASGDMQTGVEEGVMGALGVGTLLAGGRGARAPRPMPDAPPMRAPVAEPSGALRPPPRQLGTASDGSVMPVRPPEPFRQSMVGGSDDLAEAALGRYRYQTQEDHAASLLSAARQDPQLWGRFTLDLRDPNYSKRPVDVASLDPTDAAVQFRDWAEWNGDLLPPAIRDRLDAYSQASPAPIAENSNRTRSGEIADAIVRALDEQGGEMHVGDLYNRVSTDLTGLPPSATNAARVRWGEAARPGALRPAPDGSPSAGARVSDLQSRADPFGPVNLWDENQPPITVAEVRRAMQRGRGEVRDYTSTDTQGWSRQDHINRIATLARDGWADPIDLSSGGGVHDGLHRLAAAIVRGDETIVTRTRQGVFGHGDGGGTRQGPRIENANGSWQIVDENGAVLERLPRGRTFRDADAALQRMTNRGPSQ